MSMKFLFLPFMIFLYGCGNDRQAKVQNTAYDLMLKSLLSRDVKEIGVEQAYKIKGKVVFLDSRTKEEYQVSHIKDAIWVGYKDFDPSKIQGIDKNRKIVVYCAVGPRSEKIAKRLGELGFKDVSNLYGGIFEWVNRGYPVYEQDTVPTDNVHAFSKGWGIWLKKGDKVYNKKSD